MSGTAFSHFICWYVVPALCKAVESQTRLISDYLLHGGSSLRLKASRHNKATGLSYYFLYIYACMSHLSFKGGGSWPSVSHASKDQFSSFLQNSPCPSCEVWGCATVPEVVPSLQSPPVAGARESMMTLPNLECNRAMEHMTQGSWVKYISRL